MHLALWQYILMRSDRRKAIHGDMPAADVRECWSGFLVGLSWWDFERHFKVVASSHSRETLRFRPVPDVLVVSPHPLLAKAQRDAEWAQSCRAGLLAFCNHGPHESCAFKDAEELDHMPDDEVAGLLREFVRGGVAQRGPPQCLPQQRRLSI